MFNFQHSQITQKKIEQLADLLLKYPKVYYIKVSCWKSNFITTFTPKT